MSVPKTAVLLSRFNRKLEKIIGADLPILKKVRTFVSSSGGKRLRPLIHYYVARMLGYKGRECIDVGAIGELIHAASLLHDDVIDEADKRRGKETLHRQYDNKTAILSGDFLLACGLDHLHSLSNAQELLPLFTRVIRGLAVGELLQMEHERNLEINADAYERIIYGKTAGLFGAMTEAAAILAGAQANVRKQYREFGDRLGRVFQIRDDYLDYFGSESSNGKEPYQDFRRGLVTRPVIVLRSLLGRDRRKVLDGIWTQENRRDSAEGVALWQTLAEEVSLKSRLLLELNEEMALLSRVLEANQESSYGRSVAERLETLRLE